MHARAARQTMPTAASNAATTASSSTTTSQESAPGYINSLMLNFRELIIGLQDEGDHLRHKLTDIRRRNRDTKVKLHNLQKTIPTSALPKELLINTRAPPQAPPPPPPLPNIKDRIARISALSNNTPEAPWSYTSGRLDLNNNKDSHSNPHSSLKPLPRLKQPTISSSITTSTRFSDSLHNQTHARMMGTAVKQRGVLIVLEGLDRVGKSTLAKKLVHHLENTSRPVTYCRFPDRSTQVGQLIDSFLKSSSKRVDNRVMHLLFSANRWELSKSIKNSLLQGTTVIVDRYSYSGIAYSSTEKELPIKWCMDVERGLPRPDLVIYLNLPREAQYQRPGFGDERYETRERQELVRTQYERVMELSKETWLKVDVDDKSPDQVLGEVIMPIKRCLESCSVKELGALDFFEPSNC